MLAVYDVMSADYHNSQEKVTAQNYHLASLFSTDFCTHFGTAYSEPPNLPISTLSHSVLSTQPAVMIILYMSVTFERIAGNRKLQM